MLWKQLKGGRLGAKFRRQHGVENFILDFYCPKLRLAIEVDGYTHGSEEARVKDAERQAIIESHGIRFLRFRDDEIQGNIERVLLKIMKDIGD